MTYALLQWRDGDTTRVKAKLRCCPLRTTGGKKIYWVELSGNKCPPSFAQWFTMIFYQTTQRHCPLSNHLPISHHSNPEFLSIGTGTQSTVPLWISQMYWSCQRLHCLIKSAVGERRCCCGSLREGNEERVTSKFITPLVWMALSSRVWDAAQRSPARTFLLSGKDLNDRVSYCRCRDPLLASGRLIDFSQRILLCMNGGVIGHRDDHASGLVLDSSQDYGSGRSHCTNLCLSVPYLIHVGKIVKKWCRHVDDDAAMTSGGVGYIWTLPEY